jgi:DNA modification methylase
MKTTTHYEKGTVMTLALNHIYNMDGIEAIKQYHDDKRVIIVTDPPFNIGYKYGSYVDKKSTEEYLGMLSDIITHFPTAMIHYPESLYALTAKTGIIPERVVSWVYNSNTRRQHREICFFGIKPDFKQVRQPYKNPNDKRVRHLMETGHTGAPLYDWWNINQVKNVSKAKTGHPCQMPLKVMDNIVGILPRTDGTIIIDPFAGSGTTLLAARNAGFDYIGFDIDNDYCNMARERLGLPIESEEE